VIDFIWKLSSKNDSDNSLYLGIVLMMLLACLVFELIKIIVVIFKEEKIKIEIEFPFNNGKYLITDGGNSKISRLMNYHFYSAIHKRNKTNYSMLFATDIVKLDSSLFRFMPGKNEDYPIFGEQIYCPMKGLVVKVINDIDDNIPYSGDYPYNTGNTIVIKNEDKYLLLGHLQKGSIKIKTGDLVSENELLANAGNSGYSERPHLHIQLIKSPTDNYWKGTGICMRYEGKNLYKNRILVIRPEIN